jgi:Protein of unknown function (DUF2946)
MKWFRSNIEHGARLALFALLVQFALSFGHNHWFAQAAPLLQSSLQQADGYNGIASADRAALQKQSPAQPDHDRQGDHNCAICAVVAMASTIVFATPPLFHLPQAVEFLYRTTDAEFIHLKSAGQPFQPRAPPAS